MHYSLFGFLRVIAAVGLVWLVVGCGEDPRYAARLRIWGAFTAASRLVHRMILFPIGMETMSMEVHR